MQIQVALDRGGSMWTLVVMKEATGNILGVLV